jgi:hypothetical protein
MKKMVAVVVFRAAFTACAAGPADRADPRSVLEAYVSAWNRHDFAAIDRLIAHDGIHDDIGNAVHAQGPGQVKEFMFLLPSLFIELKSPSRSFGRYPLKNNSRFRMAGYKRPSESFDEPTVTSVHARTRGPASVLQS